MTRFRVRRQNVESHTLWELSARWSQIIVESVGNMVGAICAPREACGRGGGLGLTPHRWLSPGLRWSATGQTGFQSVPAVREGVTMALVFFNKAHFFLIDYTVYAVLSCF